LNDENNRVRARAAMALGEAGPLAQAAAPALTKALADDYANVREAAAEALAKIAPEKAAASGQGAP
jgi:HEAT repeat protein